jgi:hypothetical protein
MKMKQNRILFIDATVNLILGVLLLLYPVGMARLLGVPDPTTSFYPTILGGVLFGIGVALLLEIFGQPGRTHGLGLGGAIAINLCGAGVLLVWLVTTPLNIPVRGYVVLWTIAVAVFGIGFIEALDRPRKRRDS